MLISSWHLPFDVLLSRQLLSCYLSASLSGEVKRCLPEIINMHCALEGEVMLGGKMYILHRELSAIKGKT